MVFGTSTSGGSSCAYPVKFILLSLSKMESMASLLLAAICSAITADTFTAILVNLLSSRLAKQTTSV